MPCDYKKYPKDWKLIRNTILDRAGYQCEWEDITTEQYGGESCPRRYLVLRCQEIHGMTAINFNGKVVLTVAHVDHDVKNNARINLKALCQLHHNRYDAKHRAENRKRKNNERR